MAFQLFKSRPCAALHEVIENIRAAVPGIDLDDITRGVALAAWIEDEGIEAINGGPIWPRRAGNEDILDIF